MDRPDRARTGDPAGGGGARDQAERTLAWLDEDPAPPDQAPPPGRPSDPPPADPAWQADPPAAWQADPPARPDEPAAPPPTASSPGGPPAEDWFTPVKRPADAGATAEPWAGPSWDPASGQPISAPPSAGPAPQPPASGAPVGQPWGTPGSDQSGWDQSGWDQSSWDRPTVPDTDPPVPPPAGPARTAPPAAGPAPTGPAPTGPAPGRPGRRPRRRGRRALIVVTSVLVVLVLTASVAGTALHFWPDLWPGGAGPGDDRRTLSAPLDGRTRSGFQVTADATAVTVRGGDLGGDLFRVTSPAGEAATPEVVSRDGQLILRLAGGGDQLRELDVQLSSKVTWALRLTGGATTRRVDAAGLTLSSVLVSAGSTRTALSLAAPAGQVPIRITGGQDEVTVRVPAGVPVRVRSRAGAGRITVDDQRRDGVPAGTAVATEDWTGAPDRYDVDMVAGVASVTVARGS